MNAIIWCVCEWEREGERGGGREGGRERRERARARAWACSLAPSLKTLVSPNFQPIFQNPPPPPPFPPPPPSLSHTGTWSSKNSKRNMRTPTIIGTNARDCKQKGGEIKEGHDMTWPNTLSVAVRARHASTLLQVIGWFKLSAPASLLLAPTSPFLVSCDCRDWLSLVPARLSLVPARDRVTVTVPCILLVPVTVAVTVRDRDSPCIFPSIRHYIYKYKYIYNIAIILKDTRTHQTRTHTHKHGGRRSWDLAGGRGKTNLKKTEKMKNIPLRYGWGVGRCWVLAARGGVALAMSTCRMPCVSSISYVHTHTHIYIYTSYIMYIYLHTYIHLCIYDLYICTLCRWWQTTCNVNLRIRMCVGRGVKSCTHKHTPHTHTHKHTPHTHTITHKYTHGNLRIRMCVSRRVKATRAVVVITKKSAWARR
jgi:hypothetical protein